MIGKLASGHDMLKLCHYHVINKCCLPYSIYFILRQLPLGPGILQPRMTLDRVIDYVIWDTKDVGF